jgi:hypothetical protein
MLLKPGARTVLHRDKAKDRRAAKDNKGDNGDDFDQGEPEFAFRKEA